ncbi:MAG: PDZ domain-containing protein [Acidobacteriaceae bacterium]
MNPFLRLALAVCSLAIGTVAYAAPPQRIPAAQSPGPVVAHASEGYLGIVCGDVTSDRVAALKLKRVTGAEVINVDRDAPAGKIGLRPHDVILQMNGQPVAGEEQLRRMLRETPAGHTVTLLISRDGQRQTLSVQLADRAILEQDAWSQPMVIPAPEDDDTYFLEGPSGHSVGSGFFGAFALGSPSVGVELDVLGSQLADYFGVKDGQGLLVKRVAENSPAARAGLLAGDVIIQANGQKMATLGEWMKMIHANRGKQIPITLIRNRKQQTFTLQTTTGRHHSQLLVPHSFPSPDQGRSTGFAWISYHSR